MAFRLRALAVTALPLLLLGGLALSLWKENRPAGTGAALPVWIPMDLSAAVTVDRIPGWDVRRGSYRLGELDGRKVLELLPEPIVEGKVLWTRAMRGGGGVRARMRGDRARRNYPRFSVGLNQERELHLRAFPGARKLELVACNADLTNEVQLATVPLPDWDWKPEDWVWLELQILPDDAGKGTSHCEGRLWTAGNLRPEAPQLRLLLDLPPAVFFAALQGAPFALKPILIDVAETLPFVEKGTR